MKVMFSRYWIRPTATERRGSTWLDELRLRAPNQPIGPGDLAPMLRGDPRDSLPLVLGVASWGASNPWAMKKGGGALNGRLTFVSIRSAPPGTRCLIPITGFECDSDGSQWATPGLITLAGIWRSDDELTTSAVCFLTERIQDSGRIYDAPLGVQPEHHDEWMDGWRKLEDVRSCGTPLLFSRMVLR